VAEQGYVICVVMNGILAGFRKKERDEPQLFDLARVFFISDPLCRGDVRPQLPKPSTPLVSWRHLLRRAGITPAVILPGLFQHVSAPEARFPSKIRQA
jgi:hypothetical protein